LARGYFFGWIKAGWKTGWKRFSFVKAESCREISPAVFAEFEAKLNFNEFVTAVHAQCWFEQDHLLRSARIETIRFMNILITAGPTREPIDPVRFLSNRSSGKMGYAMAHAFVEAGHRVILISGPTSQPVPAGVDLLLVETAAEMFSAVSHWIGRMEIAIFSAAVADFTPSTVALQKIKKTCETFTLELVRTKDVLGAAREEFSFQGILVGFAAETENLEVNARNKLTSKGCDLVVANDVSKPGLGFDSDRNEVILVYRDRVESLPASTKVLLADQLAAKILALSTSC
jgi:phosphopantothenoylcysteine synthetase/decarboxylase